MMKLTATEAETAAAVEDDPDTMDVDEAAAAVEAAAEAATARSMATTAAHAAPVEDDPDTTEDETVAEGTAYTTITTLHTTGEKGDETAATVRARATVENSVAIGEGASLGAAVTQTGTVTEDDVETPVLVAHAADNAVAVGAESRVEAAGSVAIGAKAQVEAYTSAAGVGQGSAAVAIGYGARTKGTGSIAIGAGATAADVTPATDDTPEVVEVAENAIAIGNGATANGDNGIAIGAGTTAGENAIVIGTDEHSVSVGGMDLTGIDVAVDTNTAGVASNVADIATNVEDIATNVAGISTNAANIYRNSSDIESNRSGVAMAIAFAHLPQVADGDRGSWGIGAGQFDGQSAIALGMSLRVQEKGQIKFGVSSSGGETSVGIGFGMGF